MNADPEATTLPPPAIVPSEQTELVLAAIRGLEAKVELAGAAANEANNRLDSVDKRLDQIDQQLRGAREASQSSIDIATRARHEAWSIRELMLETLDGVLDIRELAAIAMDVSTQVAERFGVLDIVEKVKQQHADSRAQADSASVRPSGG